VQPLNPRAIGIESPTASSDDVSHRYASDAAFAFALKAEVSPNASHAMQIHVMRGPQGGRHLRRHGSFPGDTIVGAVASDCCRCSKSFRPTSKNVRRLQLVHAPLSQRCPPAAIGRARGLQRRRHSPVLPLWVNKKLASASEPRRRSVL
jgi:hypothetical protein